MTYDITTSLGSNKTPITFSACRIEAIDRRKCQNKVEELTIILRVEVLSTFDLGGKSLRASLHYVKSVASCKTLTKLLQDVVVVRAIFT